MGVYDDIYVGESVKWSNWRTKETRVSQKTINSRWKKEITRNRSRRRKEEKTTRNNAERPFQRKREKNHGANRRRAKKLSPS